MRKSTLTYREFLSFLVRLLNQPFIKFTLTLISVAFYAVSLNVMNSLMMIIKRRLNHLMNQVEDGRSPEEELD